MCGEKSKDKEREERREIVKEASEEQDAASSV